MPAVRGAQSPYGTVTAGTLAVGLGIAAAIEPRLALVITATAFVPLMLWADPRLAFAWFGFSLAVNTDVLSAPVHVSLPQLFLLAVMASALLRWRTGAPKRAGVWAAGGLLFATATTLSLLRAIHPAAAVVGILEVFVLGSAAFVITRHMIRHPDVVRYVVPALVVGAGLTAIPAMFQVVFDIGPAPFRAGGVMRAYATFSEPNTYGMYLAGVLPLALLLVVEKRTMVAALGAGAIALALGLTGSRGAWVGAVAGLVLFGLLVFRLRARTLIAILACCTALGVLVLALPRELLLARFDLGDWSVQQRLLVLLTAVDGIAQSPVFGHGAGSFPILLGALGRQGLVDDVTMAHNLILDVWFQFGVLAVLVLAGLALAFGFAAGRAARRANDARIAALLAAAGAMFVTSMFGTLFIRGVQELFVLVVAMTAALVLCPAPDAGARHA